MDPEYAGIVGFNDTELRQYFGGFIKDVAKTRGENVKEILDEMRLWHDGFRFTVKNESLYNPISVIEYLRSNGDVQAWSKTGGPSQFLVNRLKKYPRYALQIIEDSVSKNTVIDATTRELTGKINLEDNSTESLIVLLYHNGYLSVSSCENKTNIFTLVFSNLEVTEDFLMRFYTSSTKLNDKTYLKLMDSITQDMVDRRWESLIKNLNIFNGDTPYNLLTNQRRNIEAYVQHLIYIIFKTTKTRCNYRVRMEVPTNKGRIDFLLQCEKETIIIEPKMDHNPENPLYECKEKYILPYMRDLKHEVICVGLKFNRHGITTSWGVAIFSREKGLIKEVGNITLTTQFNREEEQNIINQLKDFQQEHPNFILQSEKLLEFLKQIGPTIEYEDDRVFAVQTTTADIKNLCIFLEKIKKSFEPNFKHIIDSFLEREKKREKDEQKRKSDRKNYSI